jgi:4-hydroxybenzoate polyprenyltransferase
MLSNTSQFPFISVAFLGTVFIWLFYSIKYKKNNFLRLMVISVVKIFTYYIALILCLIVCAKFKHPIQYAIPLVLIIYSLFQIGWHTFKAYQYLGYSQDWCYAQSRRNRKRAKIKMI